MGNTLSQDMGNTFEFISPVLRGHVKGTFWNRPTASICEVGFEGPTKHVGVVSKVQNQPQERLQVEEALRARRMSRALRSEAPAAQLAKANASQMGGPNSALATGP